MLWKTCWMKRQLRGDGMTGSELGLKSSNDKTVGMSIYELRLDSYNGIRLHSGTDPNEQIITKLQRIEDFRKRLVHYNKNVESLSADGMLGQIYIDDGTKNIKIYCGCRTCREGINFNPNSSRLSGYIPTAELIHILTDKIDKETK